MIYLTEPTVAVFDDHYDSKKKLLESRLRYVDKKIDFDIKRLKNSAQWYTGDKEEAYQEQLAALKEARTKSLLFTDEDGNLYTHSGLAGQLSREFVDDVKVKYKLPPPSSLPYANKPKHEPRAYQSEAHDALLASAGKGPRRVEIGTGLGKSKIIGMLCKSIGLKTVIMAPSTSIAGQLYEDLVYHFGKRYVGMFFGSKKQSDKLIVVGIDDSLTRVEPGSDHWKELSKSAVFIADESHLVPAETLAKVCLGLVKAAPYRFFFSATQVRHDGLEIVLDGITGETVHSMTVKEGVDQGYLARPHFRMVEIVSDANTTSSDPNKLTRQHLYYNEKVIKQAASLATRFVRSMKRPTVILVEELEQFTKILPYLGQVGEVKFAHGPLNAQTKKLIPEKYHKDDPTELVEQFNRGKIEVLVGTSCIATGTDIRTVEAMIYLQGKGSEVKTKQAVGRTTRGGEKSFVENPWTGNQKKDCIVVDFDIVNVDNTHRHAQMRRAFYNEIYPTVETIDMKAL